MGLRESKKAATRAALGWAAIRLAAERGVAEVKVEDIAAAAGVSPRTFNNYFSSKAEAIVSRQLDRYLRFADELRNRPAEEPLWAAIAHAATSQFDPGPEVQANPVPDPARWTAAVRTMLTDPSVRGEHLRAAATAETEIAAVIAARTGLDLTRELYPHLLAAALIAATNTAAGHHLRTEPPRPVEELLPEALALLQAGLPDPTSTRASPEPPDRAESLSSPVAERFV